jgi:hypothetical protein
MQKESFIHSVSQSLLVIVQKEDRSLPKICLYVKIGEHTHIHTHTPYIHSPQKGVTNYIAYIIRFWRVSSWFTEGFIE